LVPTTGSPPQPWMKASCNGLIRSGGTLRLLISSEKVSTMFLAASQSPLSRT
jgi:hypothetical protein